MRPTPHTLSIRSAKAARTLVQFDPSIPIRETVPVANVNVNVCLLFEF